EWVARRDERLQAAAGRFHYFIDVWVELPLLSGVLLTGAVLLVRSEITPVRLTKIALGLGAIAANAACFGMVRRRHLAEIRGAQTTQTRAAQSREYFRWLLLGFPPGFVALLLGMRGAGWI